MNGGRNVSAVSFFAILALASAPAALHLTPLPGSIADAGWVGRFAAICLCLGSIGSVVGIFWFDKLDGLLIEQASGLLVAFGSLFYAVGLYLADMFPSTAFAMAMALCVTAFCVTRYFQVQRWVNRIRRQQKEQTKEDG